VKFAHEELGILGPDALLSHSTDLTGEEIEICRRTDTRIVHNPSAIASIQGRCPVTELIDAGVTVMLGSDGVAPDRSYDMFRHLFQAMRYHRFYFRDPSVLPPGKALEMVTIDAARGAGHGEGPRVARGRQEGGRDPHRHVQAAPLSVQHARLSRRVLRNGNDVDTVIVNGDILMEGRRVRTVNEAEVLDLAQRETDAALRRTKLEHLLAIPERFWGVTKGLPSRVRARRPNEEAGPRAHVPLRELPS